MQPIRVKTVQESDLRMLGSLARNIQRVLPVTQADIDAAAALGEGWVVWKVFEVSEPLDNMRGSTQLIIRQNSIQPGQNVRRVIFVSGPGGQTVVIRGSDYIVLPDAIADSLSYVKAFGGTEQRNLPDGYTQYDGLIGDGSAYIDLGCTLDENDEIEIEFTTNATAVNSINIFGYRNSASSQTITAMISSTSNQFISDFNNSNYTPYRLLTIVSTSTRYKLILNKTGRYLYRGSTLVESNTTACPDTITTGNAYLFNIGGTPAYTNKFSGIIHRCLIKGKRDVVPAGNGVTYGMYDKLNGVFYPNVNTEGAFTAGNAVVPTPDTPMDIVSNNGVLKARHQSGLPLGYTRLEYIASTGTQYIDTGFIADNTTGFYIDAQKTTDNSTDSVVYGSRASTNARCWLDIDHSGSTEYEGRVLFGWGNYTQAGGTDVDNRVAVYLNRFTGSFNYNNTRKVFIDNIERPWYNQQLEDTLPTQTGSIYMFGGNTAGSFSMPWYGRIYNFKITQNSNLVHNFIPAKNSSNIIGMYDLVSGQFFVNQGTGDFTAGDPVSDPVEIYTDGTVETINVHGKNLFDKDNALLGTTVNSQGVFENNGGYNCSNYIPVQNGKTYIRSSNGVALGVRYHLYDNNKDWLGYQDAQTTGLIEVNNPLAKYVAFAISANYDLSTIQLERGSTATTYEPYYNGGTATAEMLLKVGDYQDVQSIIDGVVTRKVGVKVLDGTGNWVQSDTKNDVYRLVLTDAKREQQAILSTHFIGTSAADANMPSNSIKVGSYAAIPNYGVIAIRLTDVTALADFKQYLADQYAAGTPVIVIYPLATPTTESVAGQTLQVQAGDNVLEITQASLNGLELEAEYQAAVSLTIQEVQDANLDPNVEVTII